MELKDDIRLTIFEKETIMSDELLSTCPDRPFLSGKLCPGSLMWALGFRVWAPLPYSCLMNSLFGPSCERFCLLLFGITPEQDLFGPIGNISWTASFILFRILPRYDLFGLVENIIPAYFLFDPIYSVFNSFINLGGKSEHYNSCLSSFAFWKKWAYYFLNGFTLTWRIPALHFW